MIEQTSYRLDGDFVITGVDEGFRLFAEQNGADELPWQVLGRPLWDYVDGPETRELLHILFERARMLGPVRFRYRCDGPSILRAMMLEVAPAGEGDLTVTSRLVGTRHRTAVGFFDPARNRAGAELLRLCSWCNRIDVDGVWLETEEGVTRLGAFETVTPGITHGICPPCAKALIAGGAGRRRRA